MCQDIRFLRARLVGRLRLMRLVLAFAIADILSDHMVMIKRTASQRINYAFRLGFGCQGGSGGSLRRGAGLRRSRLTKAEPCGRSDTRLNRGRPRKEVSSCAELGGYPRRCAL